jgi:transposase-like protein
LEVKNNRTEYRTMTQKRDNKGSQEIKAMIAEDGDFLRPLVRSVIQEFLEAEMAETVGAQKGERAEGRLGYRSGYYTRGLITRVGKLELRVPQDRNGRFSTEIFERYQRSEKALVAALTQMYIQGVSTRKVKAISEELCGHSFSASAISEINKKLDTELGRFARRELDSEYPYLIIDARYEKLRENGVIRSRAVLVAIGIDWDGRRQVLGVEMANRESATSWKDFLLGLKRRGLRGVVFASVTIILGSNGRLWKCCRRLTGSAAMCIFYAMRSITCLAKLPMTVSLNCDGFTIVATPRKPVETWRPGCFDGSKNIKSSARGSKKTLRKL